MEANLTMTTAVGIYLWVHPLQPKLVATNGVLSNRDAQLKTIRD